MATSHRAELQQIRTFPQLIRFLRDEMGWPIESEEYDDLVFDYEAEELGLDAANAAKIKEIKRLRPLAANQPWGIFFVSFEPKRLPVVALRRILSAFVMRKRASANAAERMAWETDDLLFISNFGEGEERQLSFAHFSQDEHGGLPTLRVLGWDNLDTPLHLDHVADQLTKKLAWPQSESDVEQWREKWGSAFTLRHGEVIATSKALAVRLAVLARAIRDRVRTVLAIETENGPVTQLMKAFKEALVHDLEADDFADMYAQTVAYGLLSARIGNPEAGTADGFAGQLPITSPFLRELMETFLHVGGRSGVGGTASRIDFDELGVGEVVELLDSPKTNMEAVVRDFGDKNPQEDPVIHFYEDFLKEYDKQQKVKRGVFYTPRPVVSYIVRSVDELLRSEFGLADGLADITTWGQMIERYEGLAIPDGVESTAPFVTVLDVATGTGTFLVETIDVVHRTLVEKWKREGSGENEILDLWNDYVPKHLLPRLYGYELLMAPYAIAHLKIGLKLHETGYRFRPDDRVRVYLTNSLEPASNFGQQPLAGLVPALAHEAQAVNGVKQRRRFTVVLGNPPYSISSENMGPWIIGLCEEYKRTVRSQETQIQALSDDYIKFIRLSHRLLEQSGSGIIGLVTNNGFLRGPLFRGMRESLLTFFTDISVVNLHGSSRPGSSRISGEVDENVFDIMQPVAVSHMVRRWRGDTDSRAATLTMRDIVGTREQKYAKLINVSEMSVEGTSLSPASPLFQFAAVDRNLESEYMLGTSILDFFGTGLEQADRHTSYGAGFVSQQDAFAIGYHRDDVPGRIEELLASDMTEERLRGAYRMCSTTQWSYSRARLELRSGDWEASIARVLYRPFDFRWTVLDRNVVTILRRRIMAQLLRPNIALCVGRQGQAVGGSEWNLAFCTQVPEDYNLFARGNNLCIPLWLHEQDDLPTDSTLLLSSNARASNLNSAILRHWRSLGLINDTAQDAAHIMVFHYIYAILHSPTYRRRYHDFLAAEFPRVPTPATAGFVTALAALGESLSNTHLMESPRLNAPNTEYVGARNPRVERVGWSDDTVWLNAAAGKNGRPAVTGSIGISGVSEDVWNFRVGGYQVCEKWLKDRKGRWLSDDDIAHYQKIVVAIAETIRIMGEIDEVIEEHGGWPGAFSMGVGDDG